MKNDWFVEWLKAVENISQAKTIVFRCQVNQNKKLGV